MWLHPSLCHRCPQLRGSFVSTSASLRTFPPVEQTSTTYTSVCLYAPRPSLLSAARLPEHCPFRRCVLLTHPLRLVLGSFHTAFSHRRHPGYRAWVRSAPGNRTQARRKGFTECRASRGAGTMPLNHESHCGSGVATVERQRARPHQTGETEAYVHREPPWR